MEAKFQVTFFGTQLEVVRMREQLVQRRRYRKIESAENWLLMEMGRTSTERDYRHFHLSKEIFNAPEELKQRYALQNPSSKIENAKRDLRQD
jgi:hypothetical protein